MLFPAPSHPELWIDGPRRLIERARLIHSNDARTIYLHFFMHLPAEPSNDANQLCMSDALPGGALSIAGIRTTHHVYMDHPEPTPLHHLPIYSNRISPSWLLILHSWDFFKIISPIWNWHKFFFIYLFVILIKRDDIEI